MGYPKIWTSIMSEKWWKLANGIQRGCYLQLLLLCKDGADSGHLCYKNVMELSVLFAIDRRTTYKVLTFLSQNCCINVDYEDSGMVNIFVPNYKLYQGFDAKSHRKHIADKGGDLGTKKTPTVNSKRKQEKKTVNSKGEKDNFPFDEIIEDLNSVTKREGRQKFKVGDNTKISIRARFKDGYTLEDFKHVHRVKSQEWLDTDYEKHLNPGTLYRKSKFPNYVAQKLTAESAPNDGYGETGEVTV